MIKVINEKQETEVADYVWNVYQDAAKRTTPPYKSHAEVLSQLQKQISSKHGRILGYYKNEQLFGVLYLDIIDKDSYVGTAGPYIHCSEHYHQVALSFLDYLDNYFIGYSCYFGTTKPNLSSQKFLDDQGFKCIDDTIQTKINPTTLNSIISPYKVKVLSEDYYELYRRFHQEHFSDYFFTADKIYDSIHRWKIHIVIIEGVICGCVFSQKQTESTGEVYGSIVLAEYQDTDMLSQLYFENISAWFSEGLVEIFNFVPEGVQLEASKRVGFTEYDTYMGYHKTL